MVDYLFVADSESWDSTHFGVEQWAQLYYGLAGSRSATHFENEQ